MLTPAKQKMKLREAKRPDPRGGESPVKSDQRPRFISRTLSLGMLGGLLLWAAFPPMNIPWLAWLAPLAWLWLVREPKLPGWRPYVVIWLCGTVHWLLMLEGIRLAHPALYGGWLALSAYLGVYLPAFVGLTRVAVQRLHLSVVFSAPVVWVGLELLRGHLITGFSMGLLAHTQAEFPLLIQISDFASGYTLSFVIMLIAACITQILYTLPTPYSQFPTPYRWWPIAPALAVLLCTFAYGYWRLSQTPPGAAGPTAHVALIQGALDTVFVSPTAESIQKNFDHFRKLTAEGVKQHPNLDLVAWPESAFALSETLIEEPLGPQQGVPAEEARPRLEKFAEVFQRVLADDAELANTNTDTAAGTTLLVGTTTEAYSGSERQIFNTALLADRSGKIIGRYSKTHPVMFGEYVPFAEYATWLNHVTPIAVGLSIGDGPKVFEAGGLKMSPSICFESTIPHLIRGQLADLQRRGTPADVLINLTNDGWFWGSGMLDLHFRCGVFRAVENRKPVLVVANTGISTYVDGSGVIRQRGPRRQPKAMVVAVQADGRQSPYATVGDWPAWICAAACCGLAIAGWRLSKSPKTPNLP